MSQNLNINEFTKGYIQTLLFIESQFMKDNAYIANHPKEWGEENTQLSQAYVDAATKQGKKFFGAEYNEQQFWSGDNITLEADVAFVINLIKNDDSHNYEFILKICDTFIRCMTKLGFNELVGDADAGRYFYLTHNRHGVSFKDWDKSKYSKEQLDQLFNQAVVFAELEQVLCEHYDEFYGMG